MNTTQTRRTSLYNIDLTGTPDLRAALAEVAANLGAAVQDQGEHSVTFRCVTDDASAAATARTATTLRGRGRTASVRLTTGLGVHKRTVAL